MCNPKMRSISRRKTAYVFGDSNKRGIEDDEARLRAVGKFISVTAITRFALSFSLLLFLTAFAQDFDTVIATGRIVDGSGNP
jgi:hypothetical protein